MKTIAITLAAIVAIAGFAVANRSLELSNLENLQQLDGSKLENTKAALTWINEHALEHMPIAATLRAEDALAAVALRANAETSPAVRLNVFFWLCGQIVNVDGSTVEYSPASYMAAGKGYIAPPGGVPGVSI